MAKLISDADIDSAIKSNQSNPDPKTMSGQSLRTILETMRDIVEKEFSLTNTADYVIQIKDNLTVAEPRLGQNFNNFGNASASFVIKSFVDVIRSVGGGHIHIKAGTYLLGEEIVINGWHPTYPPTQQIMITGDGYGTKIRQLTSAKNAIVIKNMVSLILKNLHIYVGDNALSGLLLDSTGSNFEISTFGGNIDDMFIYSNSNLTPGFYAKNTFDLNITI